MSLEKSIETLATAITLLATNLTTPDIVMEVGSEALDVAGKALKEIENETETDLKEAETDEKAEKAAKKKAEKAAKKKAEKEAEAKSSDEDLKSEPTLDDVRQAAMSAIKAGKRDEAMGIINDVGASKISGVESKYYESVIAALKALIA